MWIFPVARVLIDAVQVTINPTSRSLIISRECSIWLRNEVWSTTWVDGGVRAKIRLHIDQGSGQANTLMGRSIGPGYFNLHEFLQIFVTIS